MTNAIQQAIDTINNPVITYSVFGQITTVATVTSLPTGPIKPIKVYRSGLITDMDNEPVAQYSDKRGYRRFYTGYNSMVAVHRVVLYAFTGQWSSKAEGTVVHHIDSNTGNNALSNLTMTTLSDNVLRFFDGRDNQQYIAGQQYQTERINQGTVPLVHRGKLIEGYRINTMGQVTRKNNRGEWVRINPRHASKKYKNNLVVTIAGMSASLHNLMAENFLVTPEGTRFKTLMIDSTIANPYQPQNLYTVKTLR